MQQLITILHIFVSICVVLLVLIQRGKGADMGAGFGSGASNTMFGSQGATPFLVKLTGGLAILFFVTSGVLSFIVGKQAVQSQDLPFVTAPMKTVAPIPVAPTLQTQQPVGDQSSKMTPLPAPASSAAPPVSQSPIQQKPAAAPAAANVASKGGSKK